MTASAGDTQRWTAVRRETPRAQKQYLCADCHGLIAVGERHHKVSGLRGGKWLCFRTCNRCAEPRPLPRIPLDPPAAARRAVLLRVNDGRLTAEDARTVMAALDILPTPEEHPREHSTH